MIDKLLRYGVVADRLGPEPDGTILDVGAGPMGLGAVLPYRFVGVDPWYPEPPVPTQQAVRASGAALPFADRSFDYVLCIEVLEHIPQDLRAQIVAEMCRVARRRIIITHPYGPLARLADYLMSGIYLVARPIGIKRPWWLVEHLSMPYPDPRLYLPAHLCSGRIHQSGQENVLGHILIALFGTLKSVQQWSANWYMRNPDAVKRFMKLFDFPPYCRRVVIINCEADSL